MCAGPWEIGSDELNEIILQITRIERIFELQLAVCHNNLESTYEELKKYNKIKPNEPRFKHNYETALNKYKQIETFELQLVRIRSWHMTWKNKIESLF